MAAWISEQHRVLSSPKRQPDYTYSKRQNMKHEINSIASSEISSTASSNITGCLVSKLEIEKENFPKYDGYLTLDEQKDSGQRGPDDGINHSVIDEPMSEYKFLINKIQQAADLGHVNIIKIGNMFQLEIGSQEVDLNNSMMIVVNNGENFVPINEQQTGHQILTESTSKKESDPVNDSHGETQDSDIIILNDGKSAPLSSIKRKQANYCERCCCNRQQFSESQPPGLGPPESPRNTRKMNSATKRLVIDIASDSETELPGREQRTESSHAELPTEMKPAIKRLVIDIASESETELPRQGQHSESPRAEVPRKTKKIKFATKKVVSEDSSESETELPHRGQRTESPRAELPKKTGKSTSATKRVVSEDSRESETELPRRGQCPESPRAELPRKTKKVKSTTKRVVSEESNQSETELPRRGQCPASPRAELPRKTKKIKSATKRVVSEESNQSETELPRRGQCPESPRAELPRRGRPPGISPANVVKVVQLVEQECMSYIGTKGNMSWIWQNNKWKKHHKALLQWGKKQDHEVPSRLYSDMEDMLMVSWALSSKYYNNTTAESTWKQFQKEGYLRNRSSLSLMKHWNRTSLPNLAAKYPAIPESVKKFYGAS